MSVNSSVSCPGYIKSKELVVSIKSRYQDNIMS